MKYEYVNNNLKELALNYLNEDNSINIKDVNIQCSHLNDINDKIKFELKNFFENNMFSVDDIIDFCLANTTWLDIINRLSNKIEVIYHQFN